MLLDDAPRRSHRHKLPLSLADDADLALLADPIGHGAEDGVPTRGAKR